MPLFLIIIFLFLFDILSLGFVEHSFTFATLAAYIYLLFHSQTFLTKVFTLLLIFSYAQIAHQPFLLLSFFLAAITIVMLLFRKIFYSNHYVVLLFMLLSIITYMILVRGIGIEQLLAAIISVMLFYAALSLSKKAYL